MGQAAVSLFTQIALAHLADDHSLGQSVAANWQGVFPDFLATLLTHFHHWVLTDEKYFLSLRPPTSGVGGCVHHWVLTDEKYFLSLHPHPRGRRPGDREVGAIL